MRVALEFWNQVKMKDATCVLKCCYCTTAWYCFPSCLVCCSIFRQAQPQHIAAVDAQGSAGDIVGIIAGQKGHSLGDVFWRTQPLPGDAFGTSLDLRFAGKGALAGGVD